MRGPKGASCASAAVHASGWHASDDGSVGGSSYGDGGRGFTYDNGVGGGRFDGAGSSCDHLPVVESTPHAGSAVPNEASVSGSCWQREPGASGQPRRAPESDGDMPWLSALPDHHASTGEASGTEADELHPRQRRAARTDGPWERTEDAAEDLARGDSMGDDALDSDRNSLENSLDVDGELRQMGDIHLGGGEPITADGGFYDDWDDD